MWDDYTLFFQRFRVCKGNGYETSHLSRMAPLSEGAPLEGDGWSNADNRGSRTRHHIYKVSTISLRVIYSPKFENGTKKDFVCNLEMVIETSRVLLSSRSYNDQVLTTWHRTFRNRDVQKHPHLPVPNTRQESKES